MPCTPTCISVTTSRKNQNAVQTFSHISRQTTGKCGNEWIISSSFTALNFSISWMFHISLPHRTSLTSHSIKIFLFVWADSVSLSSRQSDRKTGLLWRCCWVSEEQFTAFWSFCAPVVTLQRIVAKTAPEVGSTSHCHGLLDCSSSLPYCLRW